MISDWQILTGCFVLLVAGMGGLSSWRARQMLAPETRRKLLHVSVGLSALALPIILREAWMPLMLLAAILAWLLAVRAWPWLRRRFGAVLHSARRSSLGEVWFALALALLLLHPQAQGLLYVVPVLVLSLADASAALVGRRFPWIPLPAPAAGKTLAGSTAFLVVAFGCVFLPLALAGSVEISTALAVALLVASLATLVEAICHRGLDNLLVPAVTFFILMPFAPLGPQPVLLTQDRFAAMSFPW